MQRLMQIAREMHIENSEDIVVEDLLLYRKSKRIELFLKSKRVLGESENSHIKEVLRLRYMIEDVRLHVKYTFELTSDNMGDYLNHLALRMKEHSALCAFLLSTATAEIEKDTIQIFTPHDSAHLLEKQSCGKMIEAIVFEEMGKKVAVFIVDNGEEKSKYENQEKEVQRFAPKEAAKVDFDAPLPKKHPALHIDAEQVPQAVEAWEAVQDEAPMPAESPSQALEEEKEASTHKKVLKGRKIEGDFTPIVKITASSGKVNIWGDIFTSEVRELKSGRKLISFTLTDYTSSIKVKFFTGSKNKDKKSETAEKLAASLKANMRVAVSGRAEFDEYEKQLVIMCSDICEQNVEKRMDNAPEKRVELHMHTQMSAMDGITPVKSLIERAASWGHAAIAITDHGVVQAFPDAYDAAKTAAKKGCPIKILYGMEGYLRRASVNCVYHPRPRCLTEEIVIFDIETTGLSPTAEAIIEIGAVRLLDGEITDRFNSFVNPKRPIPSFITELTGIDDKMVAEAPQIKEVLEDFYAFVGEAPLCAHNATFDTSFVRQHASQVGLPFDFCYIDTLEMARSLLPELKNHKLGTIVKHLGIELVNHHRASDDAEATAHILKHFIDTLAKQEITCISSLNTALAGRNEKKAGTYHIMLLAKNKEGLQNLYRIVSASHLEYFYKKPVIPMELLEKHREGLIIGSACESGELYSALLCGASQSEIERIAKFYDYYEVQPIDNNLFLVNEGRVKNREGLREINKKIVALGAKLQKPVVATCDVHFMDKEDEMLRRIIMDALKFSDVDNQPPLYLRTTEEMLEEFSYLGEKTAYEVVVKNTNRLADMIEAVQLLPNEAHPPKMPGVEEELIKISTGKAKEIYGENLPEIVKERMDRELASIIKHGFAVMYIIAQRLVAKSLSDGYLVGSRGSVGSSFVAFLAGITEVNALEPHYVCPACRHSEVILDGSVGCGADMEDKNCPSCGTLYCKDGYDIPFETFLGFDGDKEPDIDLNFSGDYQPIAHKYTEELFGAGYVFRAGTIGTIAEKTAYGFIMKYFEKRNSKPPAAEVDRLVKGCTGIKRTTGQHPGGIMVVPRDEDIHWYCPVQRPADDEAKDIITTHFDYHSISGKLLKLDILGHDDPTVIRMLQDLTGVDPQSIQIGDARVMNLFADTKVLGVTPEQIFSEVGTFGVPEFGTSFVRKMLVDTKPTTFAELVRISGLSHGTDVWLNNAQDLVKSGVASLREVICTRDDIMTYLIHAGLEKKQAFKIMESVRKGKGLTEEMEQVMVENNVPDWYISSCKKIKYMFPKAHAVAYVMMAFRIAYFKLYYPKEYYTTYFTVRADDFDANIMTGTREEIGQRLAEHYKKEEMTTKEKNQLTILEMCNEMYLRGLAFSQIDIYRSHAVRFMPDEEGILPPLSAMPGLGKSAAESIVQARVESEFTSIEDLKKRSKVSKTVVEMLKEKGCLASIPDTEQMTMF